MTLTPLEQIQQAEMECSQEVRAAQLRAEDYQKLVRQQVSKLKEEARALGYQQGKQDYHAAIDLAHQEAARIVAEARDRVEQLAQNGGMYVDAMVDQIVTIIRGGEES